jgi:hypothetical protein
MQALERFIPRRYKDGISQEELKYVLSIIEWENQINLRPHYSSIQGNGRRYNG